MLNITSLMPLMVLFSLVSLMLTPKMFMMCLLNLEVMTLALILLTFLTSFMMNFTESTNTLLMLSMGACEASMALACLVNMLRTHGNDNIKSISAVKC